VEEEIGNMLLVANATSTCRNAYAAAAVCSHVGSPLICNPDTLVLITSVCGPRPRSPCVTSHHKQPSRVTRNIQI